MKRYKVPRVAFVNKADRSGANPSRVVEELRDKLGHNAVLMQIPIGLEADHEGVVEIALEDGWSGIRTVLSPDRPVRLHRYPVETISHSEEGFEATYQGTCFVLVWPDPPEIGKPFETAVDLLVTRRCVSLPATRPGADAPAAGASPGACRPSTWPRRGHPTCPAPGRR